MDTHVICKCVIRNFIKQNIGDINFRYRNLGLHVDEHCILSYSYIIYFYHRFPTSFYTAEPNNNVNMIRTFNTS